MTTPLSELAHAVGNAIDWLETALDVAVEDAEACDHWKALGATALQIEGVLILARRLLPLHPEIEAAVKAERDEYDAYDEPHAMGLRP